MSRILFSRRYNSAAPVHPHRPTMEQQSLARLQRIHELLRVLGSKTDEIDDCIRVERYDARAERPRSVIGCPVDLDAVYRVPCRMRHVRLAISPAGDDYVVARVDEPRDEERAD